MLLTSDCIKPVFPITPTIDNTLTAVRKILPIRNTSEKLTHHLQSELKRLKENLGRWYSNGLSMEKHHSDDDHSNRISHPNEFHDEHDKLLRSTHSHTRTI